MLFHDLHWSYSYLGQVAVLVKCFCLEISLWTFSSPKLSLQPLTTCFKTVIILVQLKSYFFSSKFDNSFWGEATWLEFLFWLFGPENVVGTLLLRLPLGFLEVKNHWLDLDFSITYLWAFPLAWLVEAISSIFSCFISKCHILHSGDFQLLENFIVLYYQKNITEMFFKFGPVLN